MKKNSKQHHWGISMMAGRIFMVVKALHGEMWCFYGEGRAWGDVFCNVKGGGRGGVRSF